MRDELEQFYKENYDLYVRRLSRKTGGVENAEDIVQEAFYRALKYLDTYEPARKNMETWFNSIVRRAMYDFKRVELKQGMTVAQEDVQEEGVDMNGFESRMVEEIEDIIKNKRPNHRDILYLAFIRGYPPRDIVNILDEGIHNIYMVIKEFKQEMVNTYGSRTA